MNHFYVNVNEDSFYENLSLGVPRLLEANPCIKNVQLERRGACDRSTLSTWEQKHCCLLTEDLRNFYTSTDGFLLTWSLEIAGEEFPIGRMEIKELSSLKRHVGGSNANPSDGKEQQADSSSTSSASGEDGGEAKSTGTIEPTFGGSRCKLFELAELADCLVFLAYQLQPDQDEPSVWLYCAKSGRWHQLADSFSKYFRMMLVHLGLPAWQKCAVGLQLPTWLEQVYLLVAPHLLQSTCAPSVMPTVSVSLWTDGPTNLIDPAIFRARENPGAKQKPSNAAGASSGNPRKKSSCH